jgi:hypothetical protein
VRRNPIAQAPDCGFQFDLGTSRKPLDDSPEQFSIGRIWEQVSELKKKKDSVIIIGIAPFSFLGSALRSVGVLTAGPIRKQCKPCDCNRRRDDIRQCGHAKGGLNEGITGPGIGCSRRARRFLFGFDELPIAVIL